MELKTFLETNSFIEEDNFNLKSKPFIEEVYFKNLYVVKGDHSYDCAGIYLLRKLDCYYLCYPSSLADVVADKYGSEGMDKVLQATLILNGYGLVVAKKEYLLKEQYPSFELNEYFFMNQCLSIRISDEFVENVNEFIRLVAIFQAMVELVSNTKSLETIEKIIKDNITKYALYIKRN